jgi:hypothetical protein
MALAMISVLMVPLSRSTFSKLCHAPPCLSDQFFHYTPRQEPDLIPRFPRTTRIWFNWVSHHCQNTQRPLEELREAECILSFGKMWVICGQRVKSRHYCPFSWDKRHRVADHTVLKQTRDSMKPITDTTWTILVCPNPWTSKLWQVMKILYKLVSFQVGPP